MGNTAQPPKLEEWFKKHEDLANTAWELSFYTRLTVWAKDEISHAVDPELYKAWEVTQQCMFVLRGIGYYNKQRATYIRDNNGAKLTKAQNEALEKTQEKVYNGIKKHIFNASEYQKVIIEGFYGNLGRYKNDWASWAQTLLRAAKGNAEKVLDAFHQSKAYNTKKGEKWYNPETREWVVGWLDTKYGKAWKEYQKAKSKSKSAQMDYRDRAEDGSVALLGEYQPMDYLASQGQPLLGGYVYEPNAILRTSETGYVYQDPTYVLLAILLAVMVCVCCWAVSVLTCTAGAVSGYVGARYSETPKRKRGAEEEMV